MVVHYVYELRRCYPEYSIFLKLTLTIVLRRRECMLLLWYIRNEILLCFFVTDMLPEVLTKHVFMNYGHHHRYRYWIYL